MEIKPMKTESDYLAALTEVDRLWDTKAKHTERRPTGSMERIN